MQLEQFIERNARLYSDKTALICQDVAVSYSELWERVQQRASELQSHQSRGIVIRASQSVDFLITYFAAHLAGKAIVPL